MLKRLAGLLVIVALLVGCTPTKSPTAPTTTNTWAPTVAPATYMCTRGVPTPAPCSVDSYNAEQANAALVQEATAVYQRQFEEHKKLVAAGGSPDGAPTPEIRATMADPAEAAFMELMRDQHARGITVRDLHYKLTVREGHPIDSGSLVTLDGCEDNRGSTFLSKDGTVLGSGGSVVLTYGFKRVDGALKMYAAKTADQTGCWS